MCTLIVLDRIVPDVPLLVASNRDEYFRRPAAPPTLVRPADARLPACLAPQDLEAGGTWMGVNARGLFVGLTNRAAEPCPERRSRGLLVQELLALGSVAEAEAALAAAPLAGEYNPFHLFCGDGRSSLLTVSQDAGAETRALEPGAHVICNRDPDDPASHKVRELQQAVSGLDLAQPLDPLLDDLADVLRAHPHPAEPLSNPCVHTPGYGTRSSTLIALGPDARRYRHADGAPCEAKYQDLTPLLDGLDPRPA